MKHSDHKSLFDKVVSIIKSNGGYATWQSFCTKQYRSTARCRPAAGYLSSVLCISPALQNGCLEKKKDAC